ncbi:MAG: hypothetical protein HYT50_01125 [Candidatus Wildermuthbacteria bacterium]|nr:hypothetical protein [Candidatus Wildermuthbacteria bacterium]
MEGLKKQSYRGYDSSGVVVIGKDAQCVRAVGKLENLETKLMGVSLEGNLGIGHCLEPDTLVQMLDGRIKKISNVRDGEEVYSLDQKTFTFRKGKVKAWKHRSPGYVQEIRTSSTLVRATKEHRIFVWAEKNMQEKKIGDVVTGDILVFPQYIEVHRRGRSIRFRNVAIKTYHQVTFVMNTIIRDKVNSLGTSKVRIASLAGISVSDLEHMIANDRNVRTDILSKVLPVLSIEFPSVGFVPRHSIHGNFITLPKKSSPEVMQIIGYFLGDGHLEERCVRFKDMRREVLEKYQKFFRQIFNLAGRITTMSDTKAYLLEINSSSLVAWFKKNIVSKKEKVLEDVGGLPKGELSAFLKGLFDAEGAIGKEGHQIVLGMTDHFIIKTVHLLLLRFGILSSVSDSNTNRPSWWKRPYKISISSRDSIERFLSCIGFSSREKQVAGEKLVLLMIKETSTSFKTLPYSKKVLREKCLPFISASALKGILGSKKNLENFARKSTVRKLLVLVEKTRDPKSQPFIQELKMFLYGSVVFQEVISNTRHKSEHEFLYDLEVTPHQNFFANGILSHNSRWATHGGVTEENAHPHADCKGNIFVVHNGIIENYRVLREKLLAKGHMFSSQTDTEVLPHLIEHFFEGNLEQAVQKALKFVRGSFGIAVVAKQDPGKVVGARMSSPLVISVNGAGGFIASDPSALIAHSNKMVFLDDGEIALIKPQSFEVFDFQNNPKEKLVTELEWSLEEAQKGGHPHFMLKEIMEQPLCIENAIRGRLFLQEGKAKLGGLEGFESRLRDIKRLHIIACGTSYHAGLVGE